MHRRTMPLALAALAATPIAARAQKPPPAEAGSTLPAAGFVLHRDSRGFSLRRPADWTVVAPAPQDVMVISPDEGSAALIRARRAEGDLAQWLARSWPSTEPALLSAEVLGAQSIAPDIARAAFRVTDRANIVRRAHAFAVRRGDLATVFVAAAPEAQLGDRLPVLTAILDSFRLGGGEAVPAQPQGLPAMTRWADPNEQAFTLAVPQGWTVQGGLMRRGPGGPTRNAVAMTSPDRRITLFIGDPQPARFVLPSQVILNLGMRATSVRS